MPKKTPREPEEIRRELECLRAELEEAESEEISVLTVRSALQDGSKTAREIADELGCDIRPVHEALRSMLGNETARMRSDKPTQWTLVRRAENAELYARIRDLISQTPMTQGELEYLTGATRTRVNGTLAQLRIHERAVGLGSKNWGHCWYIPTDDELRSGDFPHDPPKSKGDIKPRRDIPGPAPADQERANQSQSRQSHRGQLGSSRPKRDARAKKGG